MAYSSFSQPYTYRKTLASYGVSDSSYYKAVYCFGAGVSDPADILGERIWVKALKEKLVRVEYKGQVHLLEPGEEITIQLSGDSPVNVEPLNNGF